MSVVITCSVDEKGNLTFYSGHDIVRTVEVNKEAVEKVTESPDKYKLIAVPVEVKERITKTCIDS